MRNGPSRAAIVGLCFVGGMACGRINFDADGRDAGAGPVDAAMDAGALGTDGGVDAGSDGGGEGVGSISGRVFEDVDYEPGPGTPFGTADAPVRNALVELYGERGIVGSVRTGFDGTYRFDDLPYASYFVRVVSASLGQPLSAPAAGLNDGSPRAFAEQTYESNGLVDNGAAGALGGNSPTTGDYATPAAGGPGDTNVGVTLDTPSRPDVDFGFTYNLVVNTNDDGQGTLRAAIANANAITGGNEIVFQIPDGTYLGMPADPGIEAGVAVIEPQSALQPIRDAGTTINGASQTATVGDTALGPEIAIKAPAIATGLPMGTCGLRVQGDGFGLLRVAISGFGSVGGCAVSVVNVGECVIRENLFTLNGNAADAAGAALQLANATACQINENRILNSGRDAIRITGGSGHVLGNNLLLDNGDDAVELAQGAMNVLIERNVVRGNGTGFDVRRSPETVITGNTIQMNALALECIAEAPPTTTLALSENLITNNGLGVVLRDANLPAQFPCEVLISRGSFTSNGDHGIDLGADGVTANDVGDADTGPNGRLNFPVIADAVLMGGSLMIRGQTRAGTRVEFFVADGDRSGNGEGLRYIGTETEGCTMGCSTPGGDMDPRADISDPGAHEFAFVIPAGGTMVGEPLTAIAIEADARSSEFGPNSTVR